MSFSAALTSARPQAPLPADAPPGEFSEERAWPVLLHLTQTIGRRPVGSPGAREASEYLAAKLRELPGVEVELQKSAGVAPHGWYVEMVDSLAWNVLARIPGRTPEALLVTAHYDSAPEGVGTGDDALAVAALVEVARALVSGPPLERTVILNLSGAEELSSASARSFLRHPWWGSIRAFINLDAMGTRGRLLLFQVTPGDLALVQAYARTAPLPHGSAIGQDLFQADLLPNGTDFAVYATEGKLRGLDLALYQDGYAYHTALDTPARVERGTMQHIGASTLALVRELASSLPERGVQGGTYYDVFGLALLTHSPGEMMALMALTVLAAAGALGVALHRKALRLQALVGGTLASALGGVAGLAAAALGAMLLPLMGRAFGWYSQPWLGVLGFGGLSLAGVLGVQHAWTRKALQRGLTPREVALGVWAGSLGIWGLLLILLVSLGAGAAYLPLWWLAGGVLGFSVATLAPRYTLVGWLAALVPGALVTAQFGTMLLTVFIPLSGRMVSGIPLDLVIALLMAVPITGSALVGMVRVLEAGAPGRAGAAVGAVGVLALMALVLVPPFTPERPQRLRVEQRDEAGRSTLVFRSFDGRGLQETLKDLPGAHRTQDGDWRLDLGEMPPIEQDAEIIPLDTPAGSDLRRVKVRLQARGARELKLKLPREALAEWSLGPLPPLREDNAFYRAAHLEPPAEGWELTLTLRGKGPVPLEFSQVQPEPSAEALAALGRLPGWVTWNVRPLRVRVIPL